MYENFRDMSFIIFIVLFHSFSNKCFHGVISTFVLKREKILHHYTTFRFEVHHLVGVVMKTFATDCKYFFFLLDCYNLNVYKTLFGQTYCLGRNFGNSHFHFKSLIEDVT